MDGSQLLKRINLLARERGLDKNLVLALIEKALLQAARQRLQSVGDHTISINRDTGEILILDALKPIDMKEFGRIATNVAKQVFVQMLKESERDLLYAEYAPLEHTIITGTVMRRERGVLIVSLGRAEAILPPEEQLAGDFYRPDTVLRFFVQSVQKKGSRLRIILSRKHVS